MLKSDFLSVNPISRWATIATAVVLALPLIGAVLWHRAVFGPWSDAWNLGNGLLVAFVCMPILFISPFLALAALVITVPLVRSRACRWLGIVLLGINTLIMLTTTAAWLWHRASMRLAGDREPPSRHQAKWLTPWGWKLESQLNHAVGSHDAGEVRRLVREGADVNAPAPQRQWRPTTGKTPLETAVATGDADMVKLLLELGADANKGGRDAPIWTVIEAGDTMLLDLMRDAGVALPAESMAFACREGRTGLAAWLLDHGWNVNASLGSRGSTDLEQEGQPLHIAAAQGHVGTVELLLDHGADIDSTGTHERFAPLMLAAQRPDTDMLAFLLSRGANPGIRTSNGWTAIHHAAFQGSHQALELLHAAAPELLDAPTHSGATPLWLACIGWRKADHQSIRFLLAHGAERNVTNRKGEGLVGILEKERRSDRVRGDPEALKRIQAVIELLATVG